MWHNIRTVENENLLSLNVHPKSIDQIHLLAKEYLQKGEVNNAWKILLNQW